MQLFYRLKNAQYHSSTDTVFGSIVRHSCPFLGEADGEILSIYSPHLLDDFFGE
jgi:hypothetical protein